MVQTRTAAMELFATLKKYPNNQLIGQIANNFFSSIIAAMTEARNQLQSGVSSYILQSITTLEAGTWLMVVLVASYSPLLKVTLLSDCSVEPYP